MRWRRIRAEEGLVGSAESGKKNNGERSVYLSEARRPEAAGGGVGTLTVPTNEAFSRGARAVLAWRCRLD